MVVAPRFILGFINDGEAHPELPVGEFCYYSSTPFQGVVPPTIRVGHWDRKVPNKWIEKEMPAAVRAFVPTQGTVGPIYRAGSCRVLYRGCPDFVGKSELDTEV